MGDERRNLGKTHTARQSPLSRLAPLAALALLIAVAADVRGRAAPPDAAPYHAAVRALADAAPREVSDPVAGGVWVAQDVPVPYYALDMLRPNALLSRRFELHADGRPAGRFVTLLFVNCADVGSLVTHYPLNCYPGVGWAVLSSRPAVWAADGTDGGALGPVPGNEYAFAIGTYRQHQVLVVHHFLILPGAGFRRDTTSLEALGEDARRRFYGASQVQLIFDKYATSEEERQRLTGLFLGAHAALLGRAAGDPHQPASPDEPAAGEPAN